MSFFKKLQDLNNTLEAVNRILGGETEDQAKKDKEKEDKEKEEEMKAKGYVYISAYDVWVPQGAELNQAHKKLAGKEVKPDLRVNNYLNRKR